VQTNEMCERERSEGIPIRFIERIIDRHICAERCGPLAMALYVTQHGRAITCCFISDAF
jgi:hypothetical protein